MIIFMLALTAAATLGACATGSQAAGKAIPTADQTLLAPNYPTGLMADSGAVATAGGNGANAATPDQAAANDQAAAKALVPDAGTLEDYVAQGTGGAADPSSYPGIDQYMNQQAMYEAAGTGLPLTFLLPPQPYYRYYYMPRPYFVYVRPPRIVQRPLPVYRPAYRSRSARRGLHKR